MSHTFPLVFLVEFRTYDICACLRAETTSEQQKKEISCSLDTITRLAIRQRSSAHVNPFKAVRARLYVAASRKKGASPPSQTTSSPPFVFMPAFHFPSFFLFSLFFSFILAFTFPRVHPFPIFRERRNCNIIESIVISSSNFWN